MIQKIKSIKSLPVVMVSAGILIIAASLLAPDRNSFDGDIGPNRLHSFGTQMTEQVGYYDFEIHGFTEGGVVINVMDPSGNTISNSVADGPSSFQTFEHMGGKYWIVINNISDTPIRIRIQMGSVNPHIVLAGILVTAAGAIMLVGIGRRPSPPKKWKRK